MKSTTIIFTAVLSLQISVLFAGSNETISMLNEETVFCPTCLLAPVTPIEATFEEAELTNTFTFDFSALAPVTPEEADFSDVVPEKNMDFSILAPVTPSEADFNEIIEGKSNDFSTLAPVIPAIADFE